MTDATSLDINGIMLRLPHRYPFLLVDRVLECDRGQRIRALKNVTYNEPYFTGHFPHRPIMPGVIVSASKVPVATDVTSIKPAAVVTAPKITKNRYITPIPCRRSKGGRPRKNHWDQLFCPSS